MPLFYEYDPDEDLLQFNSFDSIEAVAHYIWRRLTDEERVTGIALGAINKLPDAPSIPLAFWHDKYDRLFSCRASTDERAAFVLTVKIQRVTASEIKRCREVVASGDRGE